MSVKKITQSVLISGKFEMLSQDWKKVGKDALRFIVPALAVLVADMVKVLPEWVDAKYVAIAIWMLNAGWSALLKWLEVNQYSTK